MTRILVTSLLHAAKILLHNPKPIVIEKGPGRVTENRRPTISMIMATHLILGLRNAPTMTTTATNPRVLMMLDTLRKSELYPMVQKIMLVRTRMTKLVIKYFSAVILTTSYR